MSTLWKEDDFDRVLPCGSDESNSEFMVDPEGVGAIYRVIRFFRMRTSDDGERRCKVVSSNSPVSHSYTAGELAMAAAPPAEFLERLLELVQKERAAEESESSLLLSNAPTSVLERSGLALGNLSGQTSVGLGGRLLIELSRPPAYHTSSAFPPHDFRPGDLARLKQQGAAGGSGRKAAKAASKDDKGKGKVQEEDGMDGVVYKTTSTKIVLAVDEPPDDFVLPERIQMWASDCRPGVKKLVADKRTPGEQYQGGKPDDLCPARVLPSPCPPETRGRRAAVSAAIGPPRPAEANSPEALGCRPAAAYRRKSE